LGLSDDSIRQQSGFLLEPAVWIPALRRQPPALQGFSGGASYGASATFAVRLPPDWIAAKPNPRP